MNPLSMGNLSWIQFIQKKQPFFSVFSLLQIGVGFSFAPKEIIQDPKFTTRLRRWCCGRFMWMRSLWRSSRLFLVKQHVSFHVLRPIARASSNNLTKTTSSQNKPWNFHLHHIAAPLVAHLCEPERHAKKTRKARWSRANFTTVCGFLDGNMSCDRSNFSSITRLAALSKRGSFKGSTFIFCHVLFPCFQLQQKFWGSNSSKIHRSMTWTKKQDQTYYAWVNCNISQDSHCLSENFPWKWREIFLDLANKMSSLQNCTGDNQLI